jgi:hypothetical protein
MKPYKIAKRKKESALKQGVRSSCLSFYGEIFINASVPVIGQIPGTPKSAKLQQV